MLSDPWGGVDGRLGVVDAGVVVPMLPVLGGVGVEAPLVLPQPADVPVPLDAGRWLPAGVPLPATCVGDALGIGALVGVRMVSGVLAVPACMVPVAVLGRLFARRLAFMPPVPPFA